MICLSPLVLPCVLRAEELCSPFVCVLVLPWVCRRGTRTRAYTEVDPEALYDIETKYWCVIEAPKIEVSAALHPNQPLHRHQPLPRAPPLHRPWCGAPRLGCPCPPPPPPPLFFLVRRSHSMSFIRAQGVPKYKIGLGRGKDGRVGEIWLNGGGGGGGTT